MNVVTAAHGVQGASLTTIVAAAASAGQDSTAITVAIIGAIGLVVAGSIAAILQRRSSRENVSAATVYNDLRAAQLTIDAMRKQVDGLEQLLILNGIPVPR